MAYYLNKITSIFKSNNSNKKKQKDFQISSTIMFLNPNNPNTNPPPSTFTDNFILYNNELLIDWLDESDCEILYDNKLYPTKIIVTECRLALKPNFPSEIIDNMQSDYFNIPIFSISYIDKGFNKINMTKYAITIQTNDNRSVTFLIPVSSFFFDSFYKAARQTELNTFEYLARKTKDLFRDMSDKDIDGWKIYDPIKEYERQGVSETPKIKKSDINLNFGICQTYPEIVYLPNSEEITDEIFKEAALYRTKCRFPALVYYNRKTNGSIWRSSQNKAGLTNSRCHLDEKILNCIADISLNIKKKLIIYDARPMLSAYANRLKGAGFENVENYENTEIFFCEIDNIHSVRQSYLKLKMLIGNKNFSSNKNVFSQFETTEWPNFIYQLITNSIEIANGIQKGQSVLIHCSDGWDRASQLTALSQLILDPYYRTLEGFIVLIEKEFISFGHRFNARLGLFPKGFFSEDEISPIFLQWLDCVHQLLVLYPFAFEFNLSLLGFIAYHLSTCYYGTFIYGCEKDRKERKCRERTVSIWTDVIKNKGDFMNLFYNEEMNNNLTINTFSFHKIRIWEEYYMKYLTKDLNTTNWLEKEKTKDLNIINELLEENEKLKQQIESMKSQEKIIEKVDNKLVEK